MKLSLLAGFPLGRFAPSLFPVAGSLALGAFAMGACAASNEDVIPKEDAGTSVVPDAGHDESVPDAAAEEDSDAGPTTCSRAGWCLTSLPDSDLVFKDIWPLPSGRAFAIATSPTVGVKVLEWVESASQWTYIDDGTQNAGGLGKYLGKKYLGADGERGLLRHLARLHLSRCTVDIRSDGVVLDADAATRPQQRSRSPRRRVLPTPGTAVASPSSSTPWACGHRARTTSTRGT